MARHLPGDVPTVLGKHGELGRVVAELWRLVRNLGTGDGPPHAPTHLVGGSDQFPRPGTPLAVAVGGVAAAGSGPGFMREDAQLIVAAGSPVALGAALADGVATTVSRSDHVHKRVVETTNGGYVRRRLNFGAGFTVTDDAGNDEIDVASAASLTVEEVDGAPTVSSVSTLKFAEADGFTVTDEGAGVVRVNMAGGTGTTDEEAQMLAWMGL